MPAPALLILGCWLAFLLIWAAAAVRRKATADRPDGFGGLIHWLILVAGFALVFGSFYRDGLVLPPESPNAWVGAAITLVGLVLAVWARKAIGRNWSATVTVKEEHELVMTGPYALVRHPIYAGLLLMVLGTAIASGHLRSGLGVVLVLLSFSIKLRHEEALMLTAFPGEYRAYRLTTKRLIPFIW